MAPPELMCFEDREDLGKSSLDQDARIHMVEVQSRSNAENNGMRTASDWINFVDTPIFGVDKNVLVHTWNRKAEELTGLTFDQVWNSPLEKFVTPATVGPLRASLQDALAGKDTEACVVEVQTEDGTLSRRIRIKPSLQRDHQGNIMGILCFASRESNGTSHARQDAVACECDQSMTETGNGKNCATAVVAKELRKLIDTANAPIFGVDKDGDVNEWNIKTAEITGFSKEEALDRPLVETFIIPSARESLQQVLDNALEGNETSNFELEFRTKSNELRYLLLNVTARRDMNNNTVGSVCIAQDITEAAKQDRAVAAMARELRQLVDTANAPIFGTDVNGIVNEWNDKTAEITGYSGDEAFNQSLVEKFIVPKLQSSVQDVLDNALRGRGTSNYELEFRTKSNEIRYLLVNATTRRDAENNIVGVLAVAQDVTEAAKHDRAVAAMANELRQLIDTANAPIFGIDVDGDVNEWNDKTAEITGYTKEEAFDCPLGGNVYCAVLPELSTRSNGECSAGQRLPEL